MANRAFRRAECHPSKPHIAHGLCANCERRQWREKNPERSKVLELNRWRRDRVKRKAAQKDYYEENRVSILARTLINTRRRTYKNKYGISEERYWEMVEATGKQCPICGRSGGKRGLVVDHDHLTNMVRGVLCAECNSALGLLREDPMVLRRAIDYLIKTRRIQSA